MKLKRWGLLWLGLLMALLAVPVWAQDTAILNGGFEVPYLALPAPAAGSKADISGVMAQAWHDNSDWADVTLRYSQENTDVHGGRAAQRVEPVAVRGGAVQMVQPCRLVKDNVYSFRAWLKGANGTNVQLSIRQAGAPYKEYASQSFYLGGDWREYEVAGPVSETTEGFLMIRVTSPSPPFLIDDATFQNLTTTISDAPVRAGNLIENGSFEAEGIDPGHGMPETVWRGGDWSVRFEGSGDPPTSARYAFADPRGICDIINPAAEGRASLRLEIPPHNNVRVASLPFTFNYGRPHAVSLALRSDHPGAGVHAELEGTNLGGDWSVGTEWKRYSFTGTPTYRSSSRFVLRADNVSDETIIVWMDAVQVEEKAAASSEYVPAHPLELALTTDRPGHVFFEGEPARLAATLGGYLPGVVKGTLQVTTIDLQGHSSVAAAIPFSMVTGSHSPARSLPVTLSPPDRARPLGIFKVRAQLIGAGDVGPLSGPAECVVSILPRPREIDPRKSFFGGHIPLSAEYIALSRAVGMRWARLHDTSMIGKWAAAEWKEGHFEFYDDGVDAAHRGGMAVLGMLDGAPAWTSTQPRQGYWGFWSIPDKPGALEAWSNYVRTVVGHYRGRIDDWEVWNEPWGEWWINSKNPNATPEAYGALLKAAFTNAKAANPDARVIGIDTYNGDTWTAKALAAANSNNFDAMSFHLYDPAFFGGPNSTPVRIAISLNEQQAAAGGPVRPLWDTEGGPGDFASFYAPDGGGLPLATQAAY
ncbi:MAG: carbohydrate binding domain-containing protein, partial [Armatimonadota bacterium]|nr:carbohydrate binding domain-containing protein [Armatimonadota bacterium]